MTGGVRRSVRERRKGAAGLGWFGVSWAGWLPGAAQVAAGSLPLYIFFFLFSFSFVFEICFGF
jgi:hypothetical protein